MYVAEGLDQLILSREACESLGLIEKNFPAIGSYDSTPTVGEGRGRWRMSLLGEIVIYPNNECRWKKTC